MQAFSWPPVLLTVDNGNTSPHVGRFENGQLTGVFPLDQFPELIPFDQNYAWVISQVGPHRPFLQNYLEKKVDLLNGKSEGRFFEMPFAYTSTLGDDRLFQAYSLYKAGPKLGTVLIDVGTFITVDLITSQGLQGGLIFPGPQTLLGAYQRGAQLGPLVNPLKTQNRPLHQFPEGPAHSTPDAVQGAILALLRGGLKEVLLSWKWDQLVLTGGGASPILPLLEELVQEKEKIKVMKHFIHEAMAQLYRESLLLSKQGERLSVPDKKGKGEQA